MEDKRKILYNQLSKDYELGDFDSFSSKLDDENKRKAFYDAVSKDYDLGDYDSFVSKISNPSPNSLSTGGVGTQEEADSIFDANMRRFQEGKPIERVSVGKNDITQGSYQYKPEVQKRILENKPDMFKSKTVDMYGAHDKDKDVADLMNEGRLYEMQDARQRYLQRPITTFGESFEQGADALYQGGKNLVGEVSNLSTGSQRDYERARLQLDELVQSGYDLSNFDPKKALKDYKDRDFQRRYNEWQKEIATRKEEREGMGFFDALLHRIKDPSRPKSQYEETGNLADEVQLARSYTAIQDALQKTNGNVDEAYKLLRQESSKETWGDKISREARSELAKQRPTEGFAAWAGGMVPQMIGTGAGIAASLSPYTRWLSPWLGRANMALLTGSTSGMSMAEARDYGASEGDIWKTGIIDAAIEYGTEKLPFERYFGKIQNATKSVIGKSIANATVDNDAAQNELSDLLQRVGKEFGAGLFSKKNISEYLKDVGTEGVSEFMAEALQTISPMVYQNPEDYPTLMEILESGWEGAKGGLFMGAFLGAGSKYSANRIHNQRRKSQGNVTFADTNIGVVEILDEKDGVTSVLDANGEVHDISSDEVRDRATISYNDFVNGSYQKEASDIEDAYEDGTLLETPYDKHNAKLAVDRAESALSNDAELSTIVTAGVDSPVETIRLLAENGYSDEQIQKAKDYYTAYHRMNGLTDALLENVDSQIESANREVDANTWHGVNTNETKIVPFSLDDGRSGYVIGGDIVLDIDGKVDTESSDPLVKVRFSDGLETGVGSGDIRRHGRIGAITTPESLKEYNSTELKRKLIDNAIGEIDWNPATPNPKVGDSFEMNGAPVVVAGMNENVLVVVSGEEWQKAQGKKDYAFQTHIIVPVSAYKDWASAQLDAQEEAANAQQTDANNLQTEMQTETGETLSETPTEEASMRGTVGSPVALAYLLEGGQGSIENLGYFLHGVAGAFPEVENEIEAIRGRIGAEGLGVSPNRFAEVASPQMNEMRSVIVGRYGEAGGVLFDSLVKNSTGFVPREGAKIAKQLESLEVIENQEPTPVGKGVFGDIYDQFKGKAKEAIEFLKKKKGGEAIGALHHNEIGDIDLVWGKEGTGKSNGFGLSKLVKYHPEVLDNLQEILDNMVVVRRNENRINLESDTHKAAIRLEWDGVRKNWLLTAFEKEMPTATDRTTDIGDTKLQNDTAPLQTDGISSENKDKSNNVQSQENQGDFVSMGKEKAFEVLGGMYGDKMPHKIEVTSKAWAEKMKKAQQKVDEAQQKLDDAPIGEDAKPKAAVDKAMKELESVKKEADFWAEMDADVKKAQEQRESIVNPQIEAETSNEPMTADEFVAQQLANGNIVLSKEDYMRETGFGNREANDMNGGANKLLTSNGMTLSEAGDRLMEMDRENGTNFFDQTDSNAGRDSLIHVLGSVKSRKDLNQYIAENRKSQAKRDSEGARSELESMIMSAYHMTLEEYATLEETILQNNPYEGVDLAQIDAIFAEAELERQQLNKEQYESGTITEGNQGQSELLPEERIDNSTGNQPSQAVGKTEGTGRNIEVEGRTSQESSSGNEVVSQIEQARAEVDANPTEAQKEAGNYKKGHVKIDGYDITIENPKGGVRSGTDKNGKKWSITMNNDYGYIRGTEAVDGDHIDVFLSDNPTEGNVFVVDQSNEDGSFDESKVMYGFNSLEEARAAYLSNYKKGWESRIMAITEVSKDEFKKWIDSSHRKTKAFSEYKSVKAESVDEFPLSESEYADKRSEELMRENPDIDDIDAYNKALDEYPSYIGRMIKNGYLEDLYAKSSIKDRITLGKIVQSAGFETSDISRKSLEKNESNNSSVGEKVIIRYFDGSLVEGVIEKADKGKITVRSVRSGRKYNVSEDRIVDKSTLDEDATLYREGESVLQYAERIANEEARRKPLRARAKEWSKKLGVKVKIMESLKDVTNASARRAIIMGETVTGWYEESTGEVCLYMPYLSSESEVDATYIHEVVAHKGLRGLLGDKFDEFCDQVWEMMSEADKDKFIKYPGVNGNTRAAADEYIAHLAENIDVTESAWGKLAELIKKFLKAIGLEPKMTHADIANTIKRSYQRLAESGNAENVGGEGTRFRFSKTPQEFDAIQKEAVEKKGIVMPGLNEAVVDVLSIDKHDFNGNLKQAREAAKQWAIENYQGKEFSLPDNGGSYTIGKKAINKYVDKTSIDKSGNAMIHLSALKELPNIISSSITGEIHADYKKGENGQRSADNGVGDKGLLIHRMFGAIELDGKVYRVKTTMNEYRDPMANNTPHSYEVTEIELIESSSTPSLKDDSKPVNVSNNSITAANLLNGVEKSYDKGKKLLSESEKTLFRTVYHGSAASFDKFDHSFMGTGEGAQAYGWGTYVTEVGGIARSYATTMASKSGVDPLSYVGEYENYVGKDVVNIAKEYIRRNSFDLKKAKEEVEHDLKLTMPALSRKGAEFLLSTTEEDWTYNPNRHLYEVEIPDDNGRNYLYWEKQYTRDELEDIASRSKGSVSVDDIDPKGVTKDGSTIKGGKIVRAMSEARGPRMPMAKEASRKLSLCGFVGIEFPAEYRTGGREDNAKNYVIFNEDDLKIVEHTRFRVVNDKNGKKTLVGLHNISESKLKKAIKQGGLANPSMAVIDMDKQSHVNYGDITLVAPESLVDKKLGRNVGTYMADAYTPIYPKVTKQMSNKGAKALTKALETVDETFRNRIRLYFNDYLDSGTMYDALFYWYLSDIGKNPPILEAALPDGYTREEVKNVKAVNPEATIFAELSEEERRKVIDLYIEREGGKEKYENDLANRVEGWKKSIEDENALQMRKKFSQDKLNELEEYGYEYGKIANYYSYAIRLANASSKPSEIETFRNAYDEVVKNGLEEDFGNWLMAKEEELGVEEKLFAGYDNQGRAKYVPNTLENASKLMKKDGRAGATGLGGFNYFVAILAPVAKNTKQISAKKQNLSTQEEYDRFAKKWGDHYHKLALQLQPGADKWADYGYHRLHEIAPMANPKEYAKKEYGIELSDKFIKDLNDVKNAIRNDFPARYFETKFERPVYLNEFAAAVVPQGVSKDVMDALAEAGLPIEEYERDNNESRMAAVDKVSSEIEGVRFRVSNRNQEIFVSNAQKAVEGIKQEKATPQQWLAMIEKNGGMKAGEDKWLGLSDWLKNSDAKTITKSEILDFINQNKIRIEEVHYEEEADMISKDEVSYSDEFQSLIDSLTEYDDEDQPYINKKLFDELKHEDNDFYNGFSIDYWGESIDIDDTESAARYLGLWGDRVNAINNTRLGLTTKGLENNREIALTVPTIAPYHMDSSWDDEVHFGDAGEGRAVAWIRFGETTAPKADLENAAKEADDALTAYQNELAEKYLGDEGSGDPTEYLDMMSEDEGKHMRELSGKMFDTRETANANQERVLVIDEIQSKRHQDGREKGYSSQYMSKIDEYNKNYELAFDEYDKYFKNTYNKKISDYDLNELEQLRSKDSELNRLYQAYRNILKEKFEFEDKAKNSFNVPDAPFEKNWHELAMKRMLRYAAENGFDKVAWTTGAQQAERYDMSKSIDSILCEDETISEFADGTPIAKAFVLTTSGGMDIRINADKDGMIRSGEYAGHNISDVVGKELAGKMMQPGNFTISGEGLHIGGEGMKGFYDKMLPSFVNKYVKKWGTKVQDIELPHVEKAGRVMHSVDVTDAMKESVMEGQTMFRVKREKVQDEVDKFTSKYKSAPVNVLDSTTTDEQVSEWLGVKDATTEELIDWMEDKKVPAVHVRTNNNIIIFAEKIKAEKVKETLFHENLHTLLNDGAHKELVDKFYKVAKDDARFGKWKKMSDKEQYDDYERPEEFFVYVVSNGQVSDNLEDVFEYLTSKERNELKELLNINGYDYDNRRFNEDFREENKRGSERENIESDLRGRGVESQEKGQGRNQEQAERIKNLFDKVADMGLDGVLGNEAYNSTMIKMYGALPEESRKEVMDDAVSNYKGDYIPAMHDYLIKAKANIVDKVLGAIRSALRKAGFDVDINSSDVKYLLWRSKKPLDNRSVFDVAEDISKQNEFGVNGTRFSIKNFDPSDKRDALIKEYDAYLKTGKFNFIEAFQDRMYSVKVLMDKIVNATGKKVRDYEDAYTAENQLGSTNKPMQEKYLDKFYKPLLEEVEKLADKYGSEVVERYIYCKSGLERNEVLRQRDADEAYNSSKAELDEKLAKNEINQAQYNALLAQIDAQRQKTLSEDVDYSGIRGMLYNIKAQAINADYESGKIDKKTKEQQLAKLEANRKDEVKDWKDFAEKQVAALEGKASTKELDALWNKINAATNETLRMDYESGMIDKETYDAEKSMMKYYVPLRNWDDTTAEEMYEYRSELVRPVSSNQKRAKGRESQADNPIATIGLMAQNAIVRGNKNKVNQKFYAFVANRETSLATVRDVWYVKDAQGNWVAEYADTSSAKNSAEFEAIIDQFEEDMKLLEAQGKAFNGKLPMGMKFKASSRQKQSHVVPVMINGKEYAVYVNGNPRAAQAMNGETNSEAANAKWEWYDKIKRMYSAGLTSWNPDFIIPNMIRDGIHASTMTLLDAGPIAAAKFALNGPRAFAQVFAMISGKGKSLVNPKYQAYFEEFIANGGETGYTAINTLEDYKKEYDKLINKAKGVKASNWAKDGFSAIGGLIETANRIFEDVNRFNAYVSARESGESIMRSVNAAKNITVNFNRKGAGFANNSVWGTVAGWMSKWILFFNPAVQSIEQFVTKSKANPKRATALGATILSSGFVMPMINELLVAALGGDDEDDYWNQSDYKRRNNWMLYTGDGYVTIPLPPVLRELYGIGDVIYGSITGHITPERAVMDVARQAQSAVGFFNLIPEASQEPDMITYAKGFAPDLAAPFLDVLTNTNFMGRPIAKWTDYNKYDPEYERVYKGVSKQWVEASKFLNELGGNEGRRSDVWGNFINPAMMEHLITSYGGGIGKTINNLAGMAIDVAEGDTENLDPFRKSPIVPRFYTPVDEKSAVPGINRRYYDYDYRYNVVNKALKNYREGIASKEHPEYQKYIDEMKDNGEIRFMNYFKSMSKQIKNIQNQIKENPKNKKELEEKLIEMKAQVSVKCAEILK